MMTSETADKLLHILQNYKNGSITIGGDHPVVEHLDKNYDANQCAKMIESMNLFMQDYRVREECVIAADNTYTIVDNITQQSFNLPLTWDITLENLSRYFSITGHAFAIDYTKSYIIPFALDIDCIACKSGNCKIRGASNSVLAVIRLDIIRELSKILPSEHASTAIIFQSSNMCNLHVYFDFSVSLLYHDELISYLKRSLPHRMMSMYTIDRVTRMALPFSAKIDNNVYSLRINSTDDSKIRFNPRITYFDIKWRYNTITLASYKPVGEFQKLTLQDVDKEWQSLSDDARFVLSVSIDLKPDTMSGVSKLVSKVRNTNYKCSMISNANFEIYINDIMSNVKKNYYEICMSVSNNDEILCNYLNEKPNYCNELVESRIVNDQDILNLTAQCIRKTHDNLVTITTKLGKLLYPQSEHTDVSFKFYIMFLLEPGTECLYSFYILAVTVIHILKSINSPYNDENDLKNEGLKKLILDYIGHILTYCIKCPNFNMLNVIISRMRNIEWVNNLQSVIPNTIDVFSFLTHEYRINRTNGRNRIERTLNYAKMDIGVDSADQLSDLVLRFLKLNVTCRAYKVNHPDIFIYSYDDGEYRMERNKDVTNSRYMKLLSINAKNLIADVIDESTKIDEREINKIIHDMWIKCISEHTVITNLKFNMYNYFINTSIGIFNTITGYYMPHVPFLYFKTSKAYCVLPHNYIFNSTCMFDLNKAIADESDIYMRMTERWLKSQNKLFYISIMVPGLIGLEDVAYNRMQADNIFDHVYSVIVHETNSENILTFFYMLPVFVRYNFNLKYILRIMEVLIKTYETYKEWSLEFIRNTYSEIFDTIEYKWAIDDDTMDWTFLSARDLNIGKFTEVLRPVLKDESHYKIFSMAYVVAIIELNFNTFSFIDSSDDSIYRSILDGSLPDVKSDEVSSYVLDVLYECNTNHWHRFSMKFIMSDINVNNQKHVYDMLYTLSCMTAFDETIIRDLLLCICNHYNPAAERKQLILLIGPAKCGKTTLVKMLTEMNGTSKFSTDKIFAASQGSSGASPDMITMLGSYFVSCTEVKQIDSSTLKVFTGNDNLDKRGNFQNTYNDCNPLAHVIGICNNIPRVDIIDEAVRDRIVPFELKNTYVKEEEVEFINPLLQFSHRKSMSINDHLNITEMAKVLSNVMYANYTLNRNSSGFVVPTFTNDRSRQTLRRILTKNSPIYRLMNECNIELDSQLRITIKELTELMEPKLQDMNNQEIANGNGKRYYIWSRMLDEMKVLFSNLLENDAFVGMGVRSLVAATSNLEGEEVSLREKIGSTVSIRDIKRVLKRKCDVTDCNEIITQLIVNYKSSYNKQRQVFNNCEIEVKKLKK